MGGKASYDFTDKNHWRNWWVNRVCEGIPRYERRSLNVLCLCGQEGGEIPRLISEGFLPHNIITCDIDPENVSRARRLYGVIGVTQDIGTVVAMWPVGKSLDVILLDLCCGIEQSVMDLPLAIANSPSVTTGSRIQINLQRGRDKASEGFRRPWSEATPSGEPKLNEWLGCIWWKHRAFLWYLYCLAELRDDKHIDGYIDGQELMEYATEVDAFTQPQPYSYRSGCKWMDSVAFNWPAIPPLENSDGYERWWSETRSKRSVHGRRLSITPSKIAAMRATMVRQFRQQLTGANNGT